MLCSWQRHRRWPHTSLLEQVSWTSTVAGSATQLLWSLLSRMVIIVWESCGLSGVRAFIPSNPSSQKLCSHCSTLTGLPMHRTLWTSTATWEEKHWQVSEIYKELFIFAVRIPGSWWNWKSFSSESPNLPHFLNTCIFHSVFLAVRWSNKGRKVFWGLSF